MSFVFIHSSNRRFVLRGGRRLLASATAQRATTRDHIVEGKARTRRRTNGRGGKRTQRARTYLVTHVRPAPQRSEPREEDRERKDTTNRIAASPTERLNNDGKEKEKNTEKRETATTTALICSMLAFLVFGRLPFLLTHPYPWR